MAPKNKMTTGNKATPGKKSQNKNGDKNSNPNNESPSIGQGRVSSQISTPVSRGVRGSSVNKSEQQKITQFANVSEEPVEANSERQAEPGSEKQVETSSKKQTTVKAGEQGVQTDNDNTLVRDDVILATLKRVEKKVDEGKNEANVQLEKVISEIFEIRKENSELKKKTEMLEKKNAELVFEMSCLEKQIMQEREARNTLEQYTRKENFKIVNLPGDAANETTQETECRVLHLVQKTLGVASFLPSSVSIAHRVGKFVDGKNRPVIVRVTNRKARAEVSKEKKKLKNSQIYINEDLTQLNTQRLMRIRKHPQVRGAWSQAVHISCYSSVATKKSVNSYRLPSVI